MTLLEKYAQLVEYIKSMGSVAVAFSSGVDSTFLLHAAKEALGDRVIAITATSLSFPQRELKEATEYCREQGVRHFVVETEEMKIEGFAQNPKNRCYLCKREIFTKIREVAAGQGMKEVLEGSNLDDNGDYRPGMIAIAELDIKSPLRHIGFTKQEIRDLSAHFGLPTWKKQSFACLATRIPYGDEITEKKLRMVDQAEQFLLDLGFHQLRVRVHDTIARIELEPSEFGRFMEEDIRTRVYEEFKKIGFDYAALDLRGYRTGSMNETLSVEELKLGKADAPGR